MTNQDLLLSWVFPAPSGVLLEGVAVQNTPDFSMSAIPGANV